eukprot:GHUV01011739.1.p1 GENE.GHUV01011739.1~~GHUV01011739.1.p1  ORF type:complete len:401 (+),score=110.19 GHUV01011739.1:147-1349(+)
MGKTARQLMALALVLICFSACATARLLAPEGAHKELTRRHGTMHRSLLVEGSSGAEKTPETTQDPFEAAISCRAVPTAATSKPDAVGRLFGLRGNQTCAFKDFAGHALFYTGYVPASWLHTPSCLAAPFPEDSVADSQFKVWGWQPKQIEGANANNATGSTSAIELCAFKSDRQQPTPIDRHVYRLTWLDAPACIEEPEPNANNSRPDTNGCLWGWQLDRNCAFNTHTDDPMYYDGYNRTCNTTVGLAVVGTAAAGDAGYAGGFSAAEGPDGSISPLSVGQAGEDEGNDIPGAVTSVGPVRRKAPEKDLTDSQVDNLFSDKGKGPNLNSTIVASSDDNQSLEGTGPVSDTPVPIIFDNDTSTETPASPSMAVVNPEVVEQGNAPTRRLRSASMHRLGNRL